MIRLNIDELNKASAINLGACLGKTGLFTQKEEEVQYIAFFGEDEKDAIDSLFLCEKTRESDKWNLSEVKKANYPSWTKKFTC